MAQRLKLGVRELVEFCCRDGDLGYDDGPGIRALDGLQTHQKIQRRYRAEAEAEVALQWRCRVDGREIELGGRIDLLFRDSSPPRIEEIKTVHAPAHGAGGNAMHWAQLKCYGAGFAREHGLDRVELCLNRVDLFTREERRETEIHSRAALDAFVDDILRQYLRWHDLVDSARRRLRRQARAMPFPFAGFRPQQRYFAAEVYRAAVAGRQLMIEAPTGSGKTISTLFPALKAIGEDKCDQVVYLSAKVSGQQQAVDALDSMQADLSCLVIQAKARSCPCNFDENEIDEDGRCLRCIGFFARLQPAREKLLGLRRLDVAAVQAVAAEFVLCPFELALQMLPWVDVVVCDFNYVFDPLVQLTYFQTDRRRKLLLIDELHNLVDRARGMYSASLSRRQIKTALAAGNGRAVDSALGAMQRALDRELRAQDDDESVYTAAPAALLTASRRFGETLGFEVFGNKRVARETLELSREVLRFHAIGQLFARHHRALGSKPVARRRMRLLCLNAFEYLEACYPLFQAVCGFSATLSPADYFRRALGFEADCGRLYLESGFPPANLGVLVCDQIDTRYRRREASIDAICESIAACYRARPGNYLVFFSAYHFMQQVHRRFIEVYPDFPTALQQREFDEAEQRSFLSAFFDGERRLGFAIMGGRFAEGIDYRGNALIGAIVVGVGLPQASLEQQLIQQDFDTLDLDGFDYAFRFPGLIRVMQSAGRVIRSETDRGVVVLLERRFRQPGYARYLPRHWHPRYCNSAESLKQSLDGFWKDSEDSDAEN